MPAGQKICGSTLFIVSMTQLIFGAALGCIIGQGALLGAKQLVGLLFRDEWYSRIRSRPGSALLVGLIRYSGVIAATAALVTLGGWALGDYLATSSARGPANASVAEPVPAPAEPVPDSHGSSGEVAGVPANSNSDFSTAPAEGRPDPYDDPEFKVHRRMHRAGTQASLKEVLLQRSEAKARTELLAEMKDHMRRSQYDCEAVDRASKYLNAGLDVWGFASWQVKHFPMSGYKGATLERCKDIDTVVEPSAVRVSNGA